jgi:hypothetical protein
MPMPTKVYELVIEQFKMEGSGYVTDMTDVNDLASQGYEVQEVLAIGGGTQPGGFVYLMKRTVTNIATEEESGGAD